MVSLAGGAATGRAVLSDDWLLVDVLVVEPDQRRRGLATGVLAELLDWGASRGARTALLHVETDNAGAIALYERHGFVTHHTNRYLVDALSEPSRRRRSRRVASSSRRPEA